MLNENVTYEKAYAFAVRIIKMYKWMIKTHNEYVLSKQLLRCGTSIGANIAEANGAISKADFSAKISIAYKETLETKYWINLLRDTDYLDKKTHQSIFTDADELGKILFSILKTTRKFKQ